MGLPFSLRAAAMIQASGFIARAVSVVSTFESSRLVVMITWSACATPARCSTSLRVASPVTTASSSACASARAVELVSTITTLPLSSPLLSRVLTADRPLVPYPTTTTWWFIFLFHRAMRIASRPWLARTSSVVPIRSTRNAMRAGVMTKALMSRAWSLTGAMSP